MLPLLETSAQQPGILLLGPAKLRSTLDMPGFPSERTPRPFDDLTQKVTSISGLG